MPKLQFFIGSLVSGGKERRFIELLTYLKKNTDYELLVIATGKEMHFPIFESLNIELKLIQKNRFLLGLNIPFTFFKISKNYKPDIIHCWGRMQTFYAIPTLIFSRTKLINGQITNASPYKNKVDKLIDFLNFKFSDRIISNSQAGITAYNPPRIKSLVIPNGLNMDRFENLTELQTVREKYGIKTKFAVIMVATFSKNKNYGLFLDIARYILQKRTDTTFLAVGTYHKSEDQFYNKFLEEIKEEPKIIATGVIFDVEDLVNACDIGVLFSNAEVHGEGLSNAILEYMALGKPVIANDSGGTSEIIKHQENGFLIDKETVPEIANLIIELLDNTEKRKMMGNAGKNFIVNNFTIEKMGERYLRLYEKHLK